MTEEPVYPPTPRTDLAATGSPFNPMGDLVLASFARELERENFLLREQLRVADVAFQGLHERLAALREEAGSDIQLLREVFYARVGVGEKVSDLFPGENDALWWRVHLRLNPGSVSPDPS
jgi:hypothetical protein